MKSLMVLVFVSIAPSIGSANSISWQKSIEETSRNNGEIQAAIRGVNASRYNVSGSYSGFLPTVSGTLNYTRGNSPNVSAQNVTNEGYNATLNASENLFNGFQDKAKVDQAKANLRSSEESLEITKAKVSADLKTAYANFLYAQKLITLQRDILKRRQENYGLVNLRFKSGRENRGSVLLSQANANQAKLDLLKAQNSILAAGTDLARVTGREEIPTQVTDEIPLEPLPPNRPDFRRLAGEAPEVQQSQAQLDANMALLTQSRSNFFPTLGISASKGRSGNDWFPERDKWSVGASLTFPLFNGGKDYYAARAASQNVQSSASSLNNVTKQKINKLASTYNTYQEAIEKVTVDESFREAAKLRAEIARAKYNNGLMSFEDWDVIENDLITREKTVLQSQLAKVQAESEWLQAQGRGVLP